MGIGETRLPGERQHQAGFDVRVIAKVNRTIRGGIDKSMIRRDHDQGIGSTDPLEKPLKAQIPLGEMLGHLLLHGSMKMREVIPLGPITVNKARPIRRFNANGHGLKETLK